MPLALDRDLQRLILETLAAMYPEGTYDLPAAIEATGVPRPDERAVMVNTQYLHEHELAVSGFKRRGTISDNSFTALGESVITARGLDFLADDGGLSAILGTVTVKLHADTIRDLLLAKVEETALPAEEKSAIRKHLSTLSGEAMKEVTKHLVKQGLDHLPDTIEWLRRIAGI